MTRTQPAETRGVVLAGGDSTRFGPRDKALARFDGDSLVSRVVTVLREATGSPPVLAARSDERASRLLAELPPLQTVSDAADFEGPIAGLFAAADAVSAPWMVVAACDMPLVSDPAVQTLLDRAYHDADAVVPVDGGHAEPLFAAYRTASVRAHRSDVTRSAGPQRLVSEMSTVERVDTDDVPVLDRAVTNVNTRAELADLDGTTLGDGVFR